MHIKKLLQQFKTINFKNNSLKKKHQTAINQLNQIDFRKNRGNFRKIQF